MTTPLTGSCLCGGVTFEVQPPFERRVRCHCSRCRKGTGTGHATNLYVQPSQLKWLSGEQFISRYDAAVWARESAVLLPSPNAVADCARSRATPLSEDHEALLYGVHVRRDAYIVDVLERISRAKEPGQRER